jgi:hypothetical protein
MGDQSAIEFDGVCDLASGSVDLDDRFVGRLGVAAASGDCQEWPLAAVEETVLCEVGTVLPDVPLVLGAAHVLLLPLKAILALLELQPVKVGRHGSVLVRPTVADELRAFLIEKERGGVDGELVFERDLPHPSEAKLNWGGCTSI